MSVNGTASNMQSKIHSGMDYFFSRIDIIIAHLRLNGKHNEKHCLRDGLISPKNGTDRQ